MMLGLKQGRIDCKMSETFSFLSDMFTLSTQQCHYTGITKGGHEGLSWPWWYDIWKWLGPRS